jgi:DNA polymerase IV
LGHEHPHGHEALPQVKIMKGSMELYSRLSHEITEIIQEKAPMVEKAIWMNFIWISPAWIKLHGSDKWTNELA